MTQSKILRETPLQERIDGKLSVEVEFSCMSCDGSGTVRLTEIDWNDRKKGPNAFTCLRCGGPILTP